MVTKAQELAMKRYRHKTISVLVRINPRTEHAVYKRIKEQENKSGYIKELIRRDAMGST